MERGLENADIQSEAMKAIETRRKAGENGFAIPKRPAAAILGLLLVSAALPLDAQVRAQVPVPTPVFKEQYYRMFRMRLNRDPDNFIENIYWLERAIAADFANPLYALARIETEEQWEKYRLLFMTHLNVKMVEQYLFLGNMWNKRRAFFFNAPWKEQNLESLETAENTFRSALFYWDEAQKWADLASARRFRFVELPGAQFWADSVHRIGLGELDYGRTIRRELANIESVRESFLAMPDPVPW